MKLKKLLEQIEVKRKLQKTPYPKQIVKKKVKFKKIFPFPVSNSTICSYFKKVTDEN